MKALFLYAAFFSGIVMAQNLNFAVQSGGNTIRIESFHLTTIQREYLNGDSTLNGLVYTKVYQQNEVHDAITNTTTLSPASLVVLYRQVGSILYGILPNTSNEVILYNDDLQVGDYLTNAYVNAPTNVRLDSIGTMIDFAGNSRKRFYFSNGNNIPFEYIGGLGSVTGILPQYQLYTDPSYSIVCLSNDQGLMYGACIDIKIQEANNPVRVFPNPMQESVKIEGLQANTLLIVRDIQGEVLLEKTVGENFQLQRSDFLNSGIYFIQADKAIFKVVVE